MSPAFVRTRGRYRVRIIMGASLHKTRTYRFLVAPTALLSYHVWRNWNSPWKGVHLAWFVKVQSLPILWLCWKDCTRYDSKQLLKFLNSLCHHNPYRRDLYKAQGKSQKMASKIPKSKVGVSSIAKMPRIRLPVFLGTQQGRGDTTSDGDG